MKALLILILLVGTSVATAAEKTKARSLLRKQFYQATAGYRIWHEDVPAVSSGVDGDIPMQFHGFEFGGAYQIPFRSIRWVQYYGADFSIGAAKGAGQGPVTDSLKDQPWMGLTLKPGILYRGTAVSEVGLFIPFAYRKVNWELDASANLVMDESPYSIGLGAMFVNRFTPFSSLLITVTHQHMWKSSVWGIAWQYDFK